MTATPASASSRLLIYIEMWVLVAPAMLLELTFGLAGAAFSDAQYAPAVILAQVLLVAAANVVLLKQLGALRQHGPGALLAVGGVQLALLHAGPILVVAGLLVLALGMAADAPVLDGLLFAVLGLPTLLPYAHVLLARRRAHRLASPPARPARAAVAAAFGLALAVVAGLWFATGPLPFDRATWDALADEWDDPRYRRHRMVDGLLLTGALQGRSRAQVVAMIGEPRRTEYFSDWPMVYQLGAERGFMGIDSEWLVLRFDATGQVEEARIVRD